jgi:hypothetical protein
MASVQRCELHEDALLYRYLREGGYTDCYVSDVAQSVDHADYVEAFYTSWVFKLERVVLAWLVERPSTDAQARALARAERTSFAAWSVEAREENQLLMCDFQGRTRSWLMSVPAENGASTRLFFGSAVVPVVDRRSGQRKMGLTFRALLGFHKVYSRVLLAAAVNRLTRSGTLLAREPDSDA